MWFDEAVALMIARAPLSQVLELVRRFEINPPLYFFLANLWTKPFPDPFLALRLFSAVCGIASLAAFWALAREVDAESAPLALFLACASSFWIHMSQEGRPYSLFLLLSIASSLLVRRRGAPALYALVAAAGLYTHFAFAFLILAHAAYLWRRGGWTRPWLAAHAAVGLAFLPWLSAFSRQTSYDFAVANLSHPMTGGRLSYILGNFLFDWVFLNTACERWIRLFGWALAALLAGGLWPAWRRRKEGIEFAAIHFLVPLLAVRAVDLALHRSLGQTRYLIFISPFLYLLLATAAEAIPRAAARLGLAAAALALTVGYYAPAFYAPSSLPRLSAWARSAPPGESVVHLSPLYFMSMRYYYAPERRHYLLDPSSNWLDWKALPGYPGVLTKDELASLGPCVVIDPFRRKFAQGYGTSTGASLAQDP